LPRAATSIRVLTQLLCDIEVPLGPEEELELDALLRAVRERSDGGAGMESPLYALSFWLMKRRAGQAPRLHLIGHSFGARLVSSAVLGGLRPVSLVLLQAAFSAYAFAESVPSTKHPGYHRRVVEERFVADRIVALRSDYDRALTRLYPSVTWGDQVDSARHHAGRLARVREVVAGSAMGAVGALGAGAVEVDLIAVQASGLPHGVVVPAAPAGNAVRGGGTWRVRGGAHAVGERGRGRSCRFSSHFGFQVESLEEITEKLAAAGAPPREDINAALGVGGGYHYANVEVKYTGPNGVTVDVSESGWVGTTSFDPVAAVRPH